MVTQRSVSTRPVSAEGQTLCVILQWLLIMWAPLPPTPPSHFTLSHCLFPPYWRLWTLLVSWRGRVVPDRKKQRGPRGCSFKLFCAQSMLCGKPLGACLLVEVYCVSITMVFHYKSRTSISRKADWFPAGRFRIHWGFCFSFTGGEESLELLRGFLEEAQMLTQNTMNPVSLLGKATSPIPGISVSWSWLVLVSGSRRVLTQHQDIDLLGPPSRVPLVGGLKQ